MFEKSARYYDLLYGFKDYADAARQVHQLIDRHHPGARRLLDVGCGTGRHLEHLREWYDVEGLDLNPELLEIARRRCPNVAFHLADMTDFEIEARFDVITCLFSSIAYVRTVDRLNAALAAMGRHLLPGGLIVIEPFFHPERYWTGTITANFVDEPETKIAWMYTSPPPEDGLAVLDIHYLVGTPAGVDHFTERHEFGLFTDAEYRAAIEDVGLKVAHDPEGPFGRGLYLGVTAEAAAGA